jgi:CheY-like chemotaxis protein
VLVVSASMGVRQNQALDEVQGRLVPKAELGPRVEAAFERLTRSMQDAVAAQDAAALEATQEQKAELFELVAKAGPALEPAAAASIRWAVQAYYETAHDISQRMIAGEAGETLPQDVARMQALQRKAQSLIRQSTGLDRRVLSGAFDNLHRDAASAERFRIGIAATGVLVVALLAFWGGQGILQTLQALSTGLARFGTGDFRTPIPVTSRDELAAVAEQANQMAASLQQVSEARERADWLKAGIAGLGEQLRGDLETTIVAERALGYLTRRVGAMAGALYLVDEQGNLGLHAGHALEASGSTPKRFAPGEGLVGQAFLDGDFRVVAEVSPDYWKLQSGLGESRPRQLVLMPLAHHGHKVGLLELALFEPLADEARELLLSICPQLVITIGAARASAARQKLLRETQTQAERLTAQEEELRLNNQELLAQQEELRRANIELQTQGVELSSKNAELEQAQAVLAENAEELKRVSAYKSQFLANMSHELRTPLNSMLLLSQLLAENDGGNITPKQVEYLRTIHSAGQDLLSLINEVLDLSKIEAGKQDVRLELVELRHFVAFARRLFEATAAQKGIELRLEIDAAAPASMVTDRQRLERVLLNLLSNALKFTERGSVALWIGRPDENLTKLVDQDAIAFAVTDTGAGIPQQAHERVFAPFEQVQGSANRGHAGTGLGLPIARESARLLGGDLVLQSSSAKGSRFVCVVPERSAVPPQLSKQPAPPVRDAAPPAVTGPHLLIIEDDAVLAEQLVEIAHARQLEAVVVGSGAEGLRVAKAGHTLGIILDVKLPDTDGWGIMEMLKQDAATRAIPVHFVSGVDEPQRGLALGAVGYLVKPASHADLANAIRTLVPPKPTSRAVLIVEDDEAQGKAILAVVERAGFRGSHVRTASAALEQLASTEFGCVVLDLGLPDMDGLGLLESMRKRPELGAPRIVVHTGRALSKQETRVLEAYSSAIVLKDGSSAERLLDEVRLFVRHVTAKKGPTAEAGLAPRVDAALRGVKLLLAEDDMRTSYSLSALLRGKGADVVTAETGKEALAALAEHADIRGVLMDVMMPEMDGYEAMRRLREQPRYADLPVIALTAKAMKGERERCLEAGASDYLAKPVDGEQLLSTLQRWLTRGAA